MLHKAIIFLIAVFYAYGAIVHILNMTSMSGFDWPSAPLKWQVLDVIYLALDLSVVFGLMFALRLGIAAFFLAAISQVLLYTIFRPWIIDVPVAFQRSAEEIAYLDTLVVFHVITMVLMLFALWLRRSGKR